MFNAIDFARFAIGTAAKAVAKVPAVNTRFHIGDRLNGPWPEGPFLWMHGASLGECRMLLNLAKFLQEDIEGLPRILITTQKVEVLKFLQESGSHVESAIAPADTMTSCAPALRRHAARSADMRASRAGSMRPSDSTSTRVPHFTTMVLAAATASRPGPPDFAKMDTCFLIGAP